MNTELSKQAIQSVGRKLTDHMNYDIQLAQANYETEVFPVWSRYLWPFRDSPVEPCSAMTIDGKYDMKFMEREPYCVKALVNGNLAGVFSTHYNDDRLWRMRGMFVLPGYRRMGIGTMLLRDVCEHARSMNGLFMWGIPRVSAIQLYLNQGFQVHSRGFKTETSPENVYALKILGLES